MATLASTKELRKMSQEDLQRELEEKRIYVSKLRLSIKMGTEKDTAKLRKEKVYIARILTIVHELNGAKKPSKMPTSAPATAGKPTSVKKTKSTTSKK